MRSLCGASSRALFTRFILNWPFMEVDTLRMRRVEGKYLEPFVTDELG